MKIHAALTWASGVLVVLSSLLLSGCGGASVTGSHTQAAQNSNTPVATYGSTSTHTITIPNSDMFAPYIAQLKVGDTVTWVNADTVLHTILTSRTTQGGSVNPVQFQFVLGAGKSASLTLRQQGLYYYYCDAHASLPDDRAAVARTGMRGYPMPMDGFLYVVGPGISASKSESVTMSADNQFTPWLTILNAGGAVTWKNETQHAINVRGAPGYGLLNPTSLDIQVAPGGASTVTFATVGVYDYFSTGSARLDPIWRRPEALPGATGYPVPMEGIVAVFP